MRNVRWSMAASGLAVFGALGWVMGCSASPQENLTDPNLALVNPSSTGTGGAGGQSSTSSSSGTGGAVPGCLPTDPTFASEMCGVFVALAGHPGATGTRTDPFPSLAAGIEAGVADNKAVFVCADTFNEQVTIRNGIAIYGGREDCTNSWTLKADGATTVNGPVDKIAVFIEAPQRVTMEHVNVVAPKAVGASASSIAVLVNGGDADFTSCKFTSGDGMKGTAGAPIAPDPALDGLSGMNGDGLCAAGSHKGGVEQTATCSSGVMSSSGRGGDGGAISGAMPSAAGDGTAGTPSDASMVGKGGVGEGSGGAPVCKNGDDGAKGAAGSDGQGAAAVSMLTKNGYQATAGAAGGVGKPGQGGGGGGGSKGVKMTLVNCMVPKIDDYIGASGGSGGTGGCGGLGGAGGQAGGSSIALASIAAKVTLTSVTLTPGKGGNGGDGGPGQSGGGQGPNGSGGPGSGAISSGCNGGKGGAGGSGGPGAGGQGGHSLGMAYKGTAPTGTPTYPQPLPTPGAGGDAGASAKDPKVGKGPAGNSLQMLEFK